MSYTHKTTRANQRQCTELNPGVGAFYAIQPGNARAYCSSWDRTSGPARGPFVIENRRTSTRRQVVNNEQMLLPV